MVLEDTSRLLLEHIAEAKEVSLNELSNLIENKYEDHRDFYLLATLIKSGFVGMHIENTETGQGIEAERDRMVAIRLYAMSQGLRKVEYEGMSFTYSDKRGMIDEKVYCTAKGFFYLNECREKRKDRILTVGIGILIGIVTAFFGAIISSALTP